MTTPVSFEIAKLLREKGYKETSTKFYWFDPLNRSPEKEGLLEYGLCTNSSVIGASAPTIAEVVMWIYNRYNIWISADFDETHWFEVYTIIGKDRKIGGEHNSIVEAYTEAITYTLNNFIRTKQMKL